jgi:tight adherence protein B
MRRVASIIVLSLCLLLFAVSAAGAASTVHIREVESRRFPQMEMTVSIDGSVSPKDITVTENGRQAPVVKVQTLSQSGRQFDVILALDTSDTMRGKPLSVALAAARDFISKLAPNIPLGLVTFSDRPRILQSISTDHAGALAALGSIAQTQYGTALYDAVASASELFAGDTQHNILLLSDGQPDIGSQGTLQSAIEAARAKRVAVFTVQFGNKFGDEQDISGLRPLAARTGGTHTSTVESELSAVYVALASQLSHQYVVTYKSVSPPGSQVTLEVSTPFGSDTSLVLNPVPPPSIAPPSRAPAILRGTVGLLIALGLTFLALFVVLTMFLGANARNRRQRELARRMAAPNDPGETVQATEGEDSFAGWAGWIPAPVATAGKQLAEAGGFSDAIERRLEQAGMPVRVGEFVATSFLSALAAALIAGLFFRSAIFAVIFALAGGAIPWVFLGTKLSRRVNTLHSQLPDVMMILASSMRAGQSFLQALDTVAKEIGEPTAHEFSRVVAEIRLGRPVAEAMDALAERVGTAEFKWAIMAVNVQREVGGNLAEILDTVAETVRERDTVRRQVKVLSAEGRLSVKILVALPFLMTLYVAKVNPGYIKLLWTTRPGLLMVGVASALMVIGIYWARKVVKIDV